MDDGTEPPKLSSLATSRKEVENDCFLENQTTIAEKRIRNKGMNNESFQERPKRSTTRKAPCPCHEPDDKPPQTICAVDDDHEDLSNAAHSALSACGALDDDHEDSSNAARSVHSACGELDDEQQDLLNAARSVHTALEQSFSDPFWKKIEPFFASITTQDLLLLKTALNSSEELNQSQSQDVLKHSCSSGGEKGSLDKRSASSFEGLGIAKMSSAVPSLFQRALSALIIKDEDEDMYNPNEGRSLLFHPMRAPSSSLSDITDFDFNVEDIVGSEIRSEADLQSHDDRLLQELHNIGLFPEKMPHSEDKEEWIDREIKELKEKLCQQAAIKKKHLEKIDKAIQSGQDLEKRNTEEFALKLLIIRTYLKTMGDRRRKYARSLGHKPSKNAAYTLIQRTLARCKEYEDTGRTCFSQPDLQQILFSAPPPRKDPEPIQYDGLMIGSSMCSEMHSKVSSGGSGSIEGHNTPTEKLHLGFSGSWQALAHSLKGKEIMSRQSGHKDEAVMRDRERKRKLVDRNSTSPASNFLVDSLGTDNISKATSREKLPSAQPTTDKPTDAMVRFKDELRK